MLILKAADGAFSLQTDILFEASHNEIVNIMFILFRSLAFVESLLYVDNMCYISFFRTLFQQICS